MPKAKAPGSAAGPATEVAPGDKGMLEVMELPGRLIRVCGAGILGRGAENDLVEVPRSNLISRRHAQVIVEGDSAWIVDLGSTAGTMVDGRKCRPQEKVRIREGSVVTLAETSFTFRASR
jgi:pSer/pThr/pTyr-binding forkhead associated (FHA) protein